MTSDNLENFAAYNAAHALSLAGLRARGYRAKSRYLVFQALPYTLGLDEPEWRVLATCHDRRNKYEYEGELNIDERLLAEMLAVTVKLLRALETLGPIGPAGGEVGFTT